MKSVKRKKGLIAMVVIIGIILAVSIPSAKTEASVSLTDACWPQDNVDVCFVNLNGDMIRVFGCRNGAISWDPACWPGGGNPPDEP